MKRCIAGLVVILLLFPLVARAEGPIIEEADFDQLRVQVEALQSQPATFAKKEKKVRPEKNKTSSIEEIDESAVVEKPSTTKSIDEVKMKMDVKVAPAFRKYPREGAFRAGIVGPGIYAGNKSIDAMMGIGAEGEYFFFENLSGGLHINLATDFKSDPSPNTILSFVPQARYVFDFDRHPRWSAYVQAGIGIALIDGAHVAADIAIPGGGVWWQWDEKFSVGFEISLHVLARGETAVAFFAGPAFRYQF